MFLLWKCLTFKKTMHYNNIQGGAEVIVRKNIRMSKSIAEWYERRSAETGISQSNLMTMALDAYIKQEEAINTMKGFKEMVEQLESLNLNIGRASKQEDS